MRTRILSGPREMKAMRDWAKSTRQLELCAKDSDKENEAKYHNRTILWPSLMSNKSYAIISIQEEMNEWVATADRWQAAYNDAMASGFGMLWLQRHKELNLD